MTRTELKELLDLKPLRRISADMHADPLLRSMERVRERARKRYRDDLLVLYADRSLTEDQRTKGYHGAREREKAAREKLIPLEERFDREVWIPLMKSVGVLKNLTAESGRRRAAKRA